VVGTIFEHSPWDRTRNNSVARYSGMLRDLQWLQERMKRVIEDRADCGWLPKRFDLGKKRFRTPAVGTWAHAIEGALDAALKACTSEVDRKWLSEFYFELQCLISKEADVVDLLRCVRTSKGEEI